MGGRYSDAWHQIHLNNPRDVVPESNMPGYPWLQKNAADTSSIQAHMLAMRRLGVPYTDEEISKAPKELEGKTEMDALVAYLQGLGISRRYVTIDEVVTK